MPAATPEAYGSSWYAATKVAGARRDPLTVEADVDVCVIGGGLAGLTVAREVARRGWSVVVLEAHRLAWNASGRNTGFVLPGYAAPTEALVARVGLDHARELWRLSEMGAEYVRNAVREADMPGVDLSEGGWLRVSKTGDDPTVGATVDLLAGRFGAAVEAWPVEQVREVLRSPLYFNAIHHVNGFAIHPLNYALGLAAAAEAAGARIYEETTALELDPAGVRKRIVTTGARVRAAHVVLAGNVHLHKLAPAVGGTLSPVFTYVITTSPLGERLGEAIRYPGAVSDTDLADNHYRVVEGDRLIWSGRSTVWRDRPKRFLDSLVGDIARAYPQLGPVKVEYAWTGTIGNTVHRMPQIGELSPGLWLLSGFGGHGLNTSAMGGELIARAIVEGDRTWRAFAPFEMVWAGGKFGRAAQQAYYWSFRMQEKLDGWLARQREAKRRIVKAKGAAAPVEASASPGPDAIAGAATPSETPIAAAPADLPAAAMDKPESITVRAADDIAPAEPASAEPPPAEPALAEPPAAEPAPAESHELAPRKKARQRRKKRAAVEAAETSARVSAPRDAP
jgi:glycine/D-amino acid oxidase-like deaminating enzyme